jgi:hypothetical protein
MFKKIIHDVDVSFNYQNYLQSKRSAQKFFIKHLRATLGFEYAKVAGYLAKTPVKYLADFLNFLCTYFRSIPSGKWRTYEAFFQIIIELKKFPAKSPALPSQAAEILHYLETHAEEYSKIKEFFQQVGNEDFSPMVSKFLLHRNLTDILLSYRSEAYSFFRSFDI